MDIGKNIRQARIKQGKTQTFVASQLGKTSGWLSNIERGHRKLAADDVLKIAEVLGVPFEEIFLENPPNETKRSQREKGNECNVDKQTLKPCPFCGGADAIVITPRLRSCFETLENAIMRVACPDCGAGVSFGYLNERWDELTEEHAKEAIRATISAWNRRA